MLYITHGKYISTLFVENTHKLYKYKVYSNHTCRVRSKRNLSHVTHDWYSKWPNLIHSAPFDDKCFLPTELKLLEQAVTCLSVLHIINHININHNHILILFNNSLKIVIFVTIKSIKKNAALPIKLFCVKNNLNLPFLTFVNLYLKLRKCYHRQVVLVNLLYVLVK